MQQLSFFQKAKKIILRLSVIAFFALLIDLIYLDSKVSKAFGQQAWDIPTKVYARPLSFYIGQSLKAQDLLEELQMLGYHKRLKAVKPGEFEVYQQTFVIYTRFFQFWDGKQMPSLLQLRIANNQVASLIDFSSKKSVNFLRLDPLLLGNVLINPAAIEQDRQLIKLDHLPKDFLAALLITEDRHFTTHWGISIKSIFRAFWSNLKHGEVRQGGSTITQQLMKNHFLSNQRSIGRKIQEVLMAFLAEYHYDKNTILEAYINEIYLGQNRNKAIHGFARASQFYFNQEISSLNLSQIALLVGLVKGPSYYNPRKHPERAKKRRDLVLKTMLQQGLISQDVYQQAVAKTLMVVKATPNLTSRYPAVMGLVRRELSDEYAVEELKRNGLRIFTSLDPILQKKAETALSRRVKQLSKDKPLQGAVLLADIASGEIQAVVGDRYPNYVGFNRAIDAYRQTGSVIKPLVYLAALSRPEDFNLTSRIKDKKFSLTGSDGSLWQPSNYDKKEHGDSRGEVALAQGLIHSYNLATAHLAINLGLDRVVQTIRDLGFERNIEPFPSIALGSKEMSPLEVLTLYQVIANQGLAVKPSLLVAVQDYNSQLLTRYARKTQQLVEPEAAYLIRYLLTRVTQEGTAKTMKWRFPNRLLAGKTGTTNHLKDSWYAGFDNQHLAVVWLGRDDNQPMGLTGAAGALSVWSDLFKQMQPQSIDLMTPERIIYGRKKSGFLDLFSRCDSSNSLPFYAAYLPSDYEACND